MDIESAVAATRPLGNRRAASMVRFLDLFESLGVLGMLLLVVAVVATVEPSFLTLGNLTNVAISASIVAVAGFGMTFAIAMGGFDLSVGSVQALTACVVADLLAEFSIPISIAGALLVGVLVGAINGVLIAKLHVPAFVATLGMLGVIRGAALLYTNGQSVLIMGQDDFARLNSARPLGVPLPLIVALGVLAALYVLLQRAPFGRHVCALGGNPSAAAAAGLRTDRITVAVFALVGLTAALSGVMLAAQLMVVDGTLGAGFELRVIAISVLGGTSLAGGSGNLVGTFFAALLLATINASLNLLNVPGAYQYLAVGVLLILALSLDTARRRLLAGPSWSWAR